MAFQIIDDILDLTATDEELGKPSGNDLIEGVYTLPVIAAFSTKYGDELETLLGNEISLAERDRARDLIRKSGGVADALSRAKDIGQVKLYPHWIVFLTRKLRQL